MIIFSIYHQSIKTSRMNKQQIAKMAELNQYSESPSTSKTGPTPLQK